MSAARYALFATCAPGHEPFLHEEIRALRVSKVERQVGGVAFEGGEQDVWRANLRLRTAIRVLRRVSRFSAINERELDAGVSEIDWSPFVRPDGSLRVDAHSNQSALEHTLFVEQRTKDAICDALRAKFGERPRVDLDSPDLGVVVHLFKDRCTLLVDTSGESLHKRGWRVEQAPAQLSETTAAALVLASGWDKRSPLVDPFCGSGTILVEAALIAANACPGSFRKQFGFERWPGHDATAWRTFREREIGAPELPRKLVLHGSDIDRERVEGALANARAAGFEGRIEIEVARAEAIEWKRGWNAFVVSNPPWGERIGDERAAEDLCARFGASLRAQAAGYRTTLLVGNPRVERALGFTGATALTWKTGGIDTRVVSTNITG